MGKKPAKKMHKLGLLGKNISYSFSRNYFNEKFKTLTISNTTYENFDIPDIAEFPDIIKNTKGLKGMNVTIPYKQVVMLYLDIIDKKAKKIGAVNVIKVSKKGKLIGYNSDWYGFKKAIKPYLKFKHKRALILGTGGASKAIAYALKKMGVKYKFVSRNAADKNTLLYANLTESLITQYQIIINCTPLGTFPNTDQYPDIPYKGITTNHILFDLIYNPEETTFLKLGKQQGATLLNGYKMLVYQAEKSWEIWNIKN